MKKMGIIGLCVILAFNLLGACKSNSTSKEIKESLTQTEIVRLLEEKKYLLTRYIVSYDDYREIYSQYNDDVEELDDSHLYMNIIDGRGDPIAMKEFIGKDIVESREYLESKGFPLDTSDYWLEFGDAVMHEIMISDVYQDTYYENFSYVLVQEVIENESDRIYGTKIYHFKTKDDELKIINISERYSLTFSNDELKTLSQQEIEEAIQKQPFKYINDEQVEYKEVIDLKELIPKE